MIYQETFYNEEAEQAILGAIIQNNDKLDAIASILEPEHFYQPAHQKLFKHLKNCILIEEARQDTVTLKTFFKLEKSMSIIGGEDYLKHLLQTAFQMSVLVSVRDYAKIIIELWQKREFFNMVSEINKGNTLEEIKTALDSKFEDLKIDTQNEPKLIGDLMEDFVIRKVLNKETGDLINLGFAGLDKLLGGLYGGNLVILAGKTSMGKTTFGLNIAKNCSKQVPVLFCSIEMTNDEVLGKFLVEAASVNAYRLKNGFLKPMEEQAVMAAKPKFKENILLIDDCSTLSISNLTSKVKKMVTKYGVKVVMVDYLQRMTPAPTKNGREREVAALTDGLKTIAKKFNITVIVLSQLSRENEKRANKRPLLSDLRDSGSIEQDADVVMFVHRDDYYLEKESETIGSPNYDKWVQALNISKGKAYIMVQKNRNGLTGEVELGFDKDFSRFIDLNNFN